MPNTGYSVSILSTLNDVSYSSLRKYRDRITNEQDKMTHELQVNPFVKNNPQKTLIIPIISKRLAEKLEQKRLKDEA